MSESIPDVYFAEDATPTLHFRWARWETAWDVGRRLEQKFMVRKNFVTTEEWRPLLVVDLPSPPKDS